MKWFKHRSDAYMDAKLQDLTLEYGAEGYGVYWYCLELIAGNVSAENLSFELEHDARIVARNLGMGVQKCEEIMRHMVSLGLFESSGNRITCLTMARMTDDFTKKLMGSKPDGEDASGYVYFIGSEKRCSKVKIGFSKNPWARIKDLQTSSPEKLELKATIRGTFQGESLIHNLLSDYNIQGEWFAYQPIERIVDMARNKEFESDIKLIEFIRLRISGDFVELPVATKEENRTEQNRKYSDKPGNAAKACASSSEQSSGMKFVLKDGSIWNCPSDFYAECIERFGKPGTDQQFEQAAFWLTSNPCKRKTARGMKRFLGAWLQRWHEKSCKNGLASSYARKPEIHTRQDTAPIETEASAEARNAVMDLRSSL